MKIEEAVNKFIVRKEPNWNGETSRSYQKSLATFEEFASENDIERLADLSRWQIGTYTEWLLGCDYSPVTVQAKQKKARRWLKWLEGQQLIEIGSHLAIEPLKLDDEEQTSSDILKPIEMRNFLDFYRSSTKWRGTRRHALLEVIAHVGARRSGLRALDLEDWDPEERTLTFLNRDESTRLKGGDKHQRKVILSEKPAEILEIYTERERFNKGDNDRRPLFTSRQGRPDKSTITNWIYRATMPCLMRECPHSRRRHSCEWTEQTTACQCPSSKSPHPARRGSITWQLNIGRSIEDVAVRAATTPGVIRRYYDRPDLDEDLRRRITDFDEIDICQHEKPEDVDEELDEGGEK